MDIEQFCTVLEERIAGSREEEVESRLQPFIRSINLPDAVYAARILETKKPRVVAFELVEPKDEFQVVIPYHTDSLRHVIFAVVNGALTKVRVLSRNVNDFVVSAALSVLLKRYKEVSLVNVIQNVLIVRDDMRYHAWELQYNTELVQGGVRTIATLKAADEVIVDQDEIMVRFGDDKRVALYLEEAKWVGMNQPAQNPYEFNCAFEKFEDGFEFEKIVVTKTKPKFLDKIFSELKCERDYMLNLQIYTKHIKRRAVKIVSGKLEELSSASPDCDLANPEADYEDSIEARIVCMKSANMYAILKTKDPNVEKLFSMLRSILNRRVKKKEEAEFDLYFSRKQWPYINVALVDEKRKKFELGRLTQKYHDDMDYSVLQTGRFVRKVEKDNSKLYLSDSGCLVVSDKIFFSKMLDAEDEV